MNMDSIIASTSQSIEYEACIARFLQPDQWPDYPAYEPLNQAKSEIRLLQAYFDDVDGILCISITHASLSVEDHPEYNAISYCWGPPDLLKAICIDGHQVMVRASLYRLIATLCTQGQTDSFWLDSLCINQKDVLERNWQVRMMGKIYSHAARVNVWLGETEATFDLLHSYVRCRQDPRLQDLTSNRRIMNYLEASIKTLFAQPYWQRMWVIQEFALARTLVIWRGGKCLSWEELCIVAGLFDGNHGDRSSYTLFRKVRRLLTEPDDSDNSSTLANPGHQECSAINPNDFASISSESGDFSSVHSEKDRSIFTLLLQWGKNICEDARDRVFSLVELAENGRSITIDYRMTPLDVWLDLSATIEAEIWFCLDGVPRSGSSPPAFGSKGVWQLLPEHRLVSCQFATLCWDRLNKARNILGVGWNDAQRLLNTLRKTQLRSVRVGLICLTGCRFQDVKSFCYGFLPLQRDPEQSSGSMVYSIFKHTLQEESHYLFIKSPGGTGGVQPGDLEYRFEACGRTFFLIIRCIEQDSGIFLPTFQGVMYDFECLGQDRQVRYRIAVTLANEICCCNVVNILTLHTADEFWNQKPDSQNRKEDRELSPVLGIHISRPLWIFFSGQIGVSRMTLGDLGRAWLHELWKWRATHPVTLQCDCTVQNTNEQLRGTQLFRQASQEAKGLFTPDELLVFEDPSTRVNYRGPSIGKQILLTNLPYSELLDCVPDNEYVFKV